MKPGLGGCRHASREKFEVSEEVGFPPEQVVAQVDAIHSTDPILCK